MPNTRNAKSGLFKIELAWDELVGFSIEELRTLRLRPGSSRALALGAFAMKVSQDSTRRRLARSMGRHQVSATIGS